MNKSDTIYVAGHTGLVGSAIVRTLRSAGYDKLITRTHDELDLTCQEAVKSFFSSARPDYVFLAAAKVGGIWANSQYPADFIYHNTMIGFNVIKAAHESGVKKLLNQGSSCIYPREAPQPLKEEYLLTGPLETTNDSYAVAKIAAITLCASFNKQYGSHFISAMPSNLYGPGDNYDLEGSHVLPAMIRKFHEAKISGGDKVILWGDGSPRREFLYSEDLADAALFLMNKEDAAGIGEFINIGTGVDRTIKELADLVKSIVYEDAPGRDCAIEWDSSKPNGTPRKVLDVRRINAMGWKAKTTLEKGLRMTYTAFLDSYDKR
jgi:GDP-L-fucose synthase